MIEIVLVVGKCTDPNESVLSHAASSLIIVREMVMVSIAICNHLFNTVQGMIKRFSPSMADEKLLGLGTCSGWQGCNKGLFCFVGIGPDDIFIVIV